MKTYHYVLIFVVIIILGSWYFRPTKEVSVNDNSEVVVEVDLIKLPKKYESKEYEFSINLPDDFTVVENYSNFISPEKIFSGVKFQIPEYIHNGTNLSSDTYISIERTRIASELCGAQLFLASSEPDGLEDLNGRSYTKAFSLSAGVGNRYDETVHATPVGEFCYAIRYFIHYSVLENYPEGTVKKFNEIELRSLFDSIKKTLVI